MPILADHRNPCSRASKMRGPFGTDSEENLPTRQKQKRQYDQTPLRCRRYGTLALRCEHGIVDTGTTIVAIEDAVAVGIVSRTRHVVIASRTIVAIIRHAVQIVIESVISAGALIGGVAHAIAHG